MSLSLKQTAETSLKSANQQKKDSMYIEGFTGNDWGDKMTFTVGVSYFGACFLGLFKGLVEGYPKNWSLPKKLLLNNMFNAVGRASARYGNACAAASMMYCVTGSALNFLFEDELAELNQIQKNVVCGMITGGIYKSTLGVRPFFVGSVLGGGISFGLHHLFDFLNQRGIISFEMKY